MALMDIARCVRGAERLPLGRILHSVTPATKQQIFKSGKGLEGFLRSFPAVVGIESTGTDKFVTLLDERYAAAPAKQAAATPAASAKAAATAAATGEDPWLQAGQTKEPEPEPADIGDQNPELCSRIKACMPGENVWYSLNAIHTALYRGAANAPYSDFEAFVRAAVKHFWVHRASGCRRLPYHTQAPPLPTATKPETTAPHRTASVPSAEWGEERNAPTSQDIYEILKFVPIHWTNFGEVQIPAEIRKRHIRVASRLAWFAKQPRYFDVRMVGGTLELRRAVCLHPEAHNLTKEEAERIVEQRVEEDRRNGGPLVLQQAKLGSTTAPVARPNDPAVLSSTAAAAAPSQAQEGNSASAAADTVTKIMLRIVPGYYVVGETIQRRATKRVLEEDFIACVQKNGGALDRLEVTLPNGDVTAFYRKRIGIDSAKWADGFIQDVQNSPNVALLRSIMSRCCAQWDRTHYLYVRLPDEDKVAANGFDGMVEFLRAHPHIFRTGEFFFKREDPSDPAAATDAEPTSAVVTTTKQLEDNPYHLSVELATVFHYLTPEEDSVTLSHFVESSSPAMRSVLPPRLISVVHTHPELLSCREVAPGTFAISRAVDPSTVAPLELSRDEAVAEVVKLIPPRGVDVAHLDTTLPHALRACIHKLYGGQGVAALINEYSQHFYIVRNHPYNTVFLKQRPV
jgi:hypothetical protein